MERAVVDRVEEGLAVLLIGDEEHELTVPIEELPEGASPGVWLRVTLENGALTDAEVDAETTQARRARIHEKMQRLLRKRPQ